MKNTIRKIEDGYWAFYRWWTYSIFEPVWYKVFGHKFHIIKTKLKPSPWYDADTRILYSIMAIVEWFVKNDLREWTIKEIEEEITRIKKEEGEDYQKDHIECIQNQYKEQEEIKSIYKWWKNYDNRTKEISKALSTWHLYTENIAKREFKDYEDSCIPLFFETQKKMTKEEKKIDDDLFARLHKLEVDLQNEEQSMLKKAIDMRFRMWS